MADINCDPFDAETIEALFEPTVEVPAALLLAAGCGCCTARSAPVQGRWPANRCC